MTIFAFTFLFLNILTISWAKSAAKNYQVTGNLFSKAYSILPNSTKHINLLRFIQDHSSDRNVSLIFITVDRTKLWYNTDIKVLKRFYNLNRKFCAMYSKISNFDKLA